MCKLKHLLYGCDILINTVRSRYLKVEVNSKLLISQIKFSVKVLREIQITDISKNFFLKKKNNTHFEILVV